MADFRLEIAEGVLRLTGVGPLEPADVARARSLALEHPRLEPGMSVLIDASAITSFPDPRDWERIAREDARLLGPEAFRRVAFVGPSDFVFGMGRAWEAWVAAGQVEVRTFRSASEGLAWLREGQTEP